MRTLFILSLILPIAAFTQSKKELNAQLAKQTATNDSLELALKKQAAVTDSLKAELAFQLKKFGYQLSYTETLEYNVENIRKKFNECSAENSRLTEELANCTPKKTSQSPVKPKAQESSPFSGSGNGAGSGGFWNDDQPFGNGIGNDDGVGKGTGGPGGGRHLINKPTTSEIKSDENCIIVFTLSINEDGEIVGTPAVVYEKTTTTNAELIKKVTEVVKTQTKYNASKGSAIIKKQLTIQINAN